MLASDVLYYWPAEDVTTLMTRVQESLVPGGLFIALHYARSIGSILDGREVHELLHRQSRLVNTLSGTREFAEGRPYYVDRFVRANSESLSDLGGVSEMDG